MPRRTWFEIGQMVSERMHEAAVNDYSAEVADITCDCGCTFPAQTRDPLATPCPSCGRLGDGTVTYRPIRPDDWTRMTASQRAYGGRRTAQGGEVDANTVIARSMTEKALSDHIVNLARMLGWLVHRDPTWRATGTDPGYPDLTLVGPGNRIIFAELKREYGYMTHDQSVWGARLVLNPGVVYALWRPSDWLSGEIERVLRGEG